MLFLGLLLHANMCSKACPPRLQRCFLDHTIIVSSRLVYLSLYYFFVGIFSIQQNVLLQNTDPLQRLLYSLSAFVNVQVCCIDSYR